LLVTLVVNKNIKQLKEVLPYLKKIGVLEYVKTSASIMALSIDEIKERKKFIESRGESLTKGKRFNSIFGMTRRNYEKMKEEEKLKRNTKGNDR